MADDRSQQYSLCMRPLVVSILLALAVPILSGCPPKTNLQREDKEQKLLEDSARLYWEAIRWGDEERASAFIEQPGDRVLFKDWFIEDKEKNRVEEANILQVVMTPELEEPDQDGVLRRATVYVRTRGYTYPDQIVRSERITQPWYRTVQGWFVEWDRDAALAPASTEPTP